MESLNSLYNKLKFEENEKLVNYLTWMLSILIIIFVIFFIARRRERNIKSSSINNPVSPKIKRNFPVKNPMRVYRERSPVRTMNYMKNQHQKMMPQKQVPRFRISDLID